MSIPVAVADLEDVLRSFGASYLLTSGADGRVKVVSARPLLRDGVLDCGRPGRGSTANATERPSVTLLYPPLGDGGHSLLIDGTAEVDGDVVRITPTSAVLHRAAD